jgi:dTDP-4-dehydrorhamnose reductase
MSTAPLEIWGGIECTVNRVGDRFFDQIEWCGHGARTDDLDLFADLGIRVLRYPVLWERTAPDGVERARWEWSDARLAALRTRGVEPIVGLVHHGSGPRGTSLVDRDFPEALARYARAVAERYPWVTRYTPINEPLTTARFSTLYGHWYPHARDDRLFARAILNQCRGIALAMREIRAVNREAALVQTEDLGRTYGTAALRYQAEFENERRWLTFDLLCGAVDHGHPMWDFLRCAGATAAELERLRDEPCPPRLLGVNYYLTSERFLDERLERYPPHLHGGNGRQAYADVEAARVVAEGIGGVGGVLREAWARYGRPLAVTEVHAACTREQQLRWLGEVWDAALALRADGADVRAITVWSLLGAYDWHTLVTRAEGRYEPGAFDVRAPCPRPTALAAMVRALARDGVYRHPALAAGGWWRRAHRLLYPAVHVGPDRERACGERRGVRCREAAGAEPPARPLLVTGAAGTLGRAFVRACAERDLAHRACTRRELDIADPARVAAMLDEVAPWAVVNAAGYVRVDDAERDTGACYRDNRDGALVLADACARRDIALLSFSSDLVFDGRRHRPYVESDLTSPLGVYGRSKAEAERCVLERMPSALVVRTSAFFGPWDEHNFVTRVLGSLEADTPVAAACDEIVSPTYVPDLVHAALDLLVDGEGGVWHLANEGALSWAALARRAAEMARLDAGLVRAIPGERLGRAAARPPYSALASDRGRLLPALDDAMARYCAAREAPPRRPESCVVQARRLPSMLWPQ